MAASWIDLLGAGVSGGVVVKLLDYIYQEYLRRSKARKTAKDLIDKHIDPILKSRGFHKANKKLIEYIK